MKVYTENSKPEFTPIKITIELETKEEAQTWADLINWTCFLDSTGLTEHYDHLNNKFIKNNIKTSSENAIYKFFDHPAISKSIKTAYKTNEIFKQEIDNEFDK